MDARTPDYRIAFPTAPRLLYAGRTVKQGFLRRLRRRTNRSAPALLSGERAVDLERRRRRVRLDELRDIRLLVAVLGAHEPDVGGIDVEGEAADDEMAVLVRGDDHAAVLEVGEDLGAGHWLALGGLDDAEIGGADQPLPPLVPQGPAPPQGRAGPARH